jgi:hypothetical protein
MAQGPPAMLPFTLDRARRGHARRYSPLSFLRGAVRGAAVAAVGGALLGAVGLLAAAGIAGGLLAGRKARAATSNE